MSMDIRMRCWASSSHLHPHRGAPSTRVHLGLPRVQLCCGHHAPPLREQVVARAHEGAGRTSTVQTLSAGAASQDALLEPPSAAQPPTRSSPSEEETDTSSGTSQGTAAATAQASAPSPSPEKDAAHQSDSSSTAAAATNAHAAEAASSSNGSSTSHHAGSSSDSANGSSQQHQQPQHQNLLAYASANMPAQVAAVLAAATALANGNPASRLVTSITSPAAPSTTTAQLDPVEVAAQMGAFSSQRNSSSSSTAYLAPHSSPSTSSSTSTVTAYAKASQEEASISGNSSGNNSNSSSSAGRAGSNGRHRNDDDDDDDDEDDHGLGGSGDDDDNENEGNGMGNRAKSQPYSEGSPPAGDQASYLMQQLQELRAALEATTEDKLHAEARAQEAELRAQEAHDSLVQAQEMSSSLNKQYNALCEELDSFRARYSGDGSAGSVQLQGDKEGELDRQVEDLQTQLEDLDYRLGWALRDLRAHQLVLRAQGELSMHLSGLPPNMQQQVFDQVDNGAELLGDGGSATVRAITLGGEALAVKVMPLYDINTARPYHFRDICTTFLRHARSPYIEMPLHTFLRLKDDEAEGTQYFLYTVWPRRHMDVDQLLCSRALQPAEVLTIMSHSVLALQDLALARMVHADVKPPNILVMLGADGLVASAHLTDFGSVQFVAPGEDAAPAIWDGALAWNWPPEQRSQVYLEACDTWGLGLLYSCMRVTNPTKPSVTDVLQDETVSDATFDRVRDTELLPDNPSDPPEMRALTRLMRRCVVRDPHRRPSMRDLATSIQQLKDQMHARLGGAAAGGGNTPAGKASRSSIAGRK